MIEIICDGSDDKRGNESISKQPSIRRPKNIKQIGDVSSDKKIYIEDYAFTYINSIAYNCPEEEQAGVLLGECQKNDEEKCVFIKGVIKARFTGSESGIRFNENVWNGIYSDIEKYFPDLQVVGWFAAMPQVLDSGMHRLKKTHLDNFSGNMKVLYLIDIAEKEENFYLYDKDELHKQKGYVCFYERNYEMQEYMLERREKKSSEETETDNVMKSIRNIISEKEDIRQRKKGSLHLHGLKAVMAVAVLVMGINLVNNYERMKNFDDSINKLAAQVSNVNDETGSSDIAVDGGAVSVNKLDGDVNPTQGQTESQSATVKQPSATEEDKSSIATKAPTETESIADAANTSKIYIVESGDTIMKISKNYYGTAEKYQDILDANNLEDPDKLYIGQEIKLP